MKLIVGLGNPGEEYTNTRHNVGYMVLDEYLNRAGLNDGLKNEKKFDGDLLRAAGVMLFKPTTFMNNSGIAVSKLTRFYNINLDDVLVIHDDLDIQLGDWKIGQGVGPKVHNGVNSINQELKSEDYWRIRVGVEAREGEMKNIPGEKYVLSKFSDKEQGLLKIVFDEVIEEIKEWSA